MQLYTIGHSTRKLEELINVLKAYGIEILVDVRHFPKSKHNPQFNKENLERELPKHGISYFWLEPLGGFRKSGYKNYTKTKEFEQGLKELIKIAEDGKIVIMCAEILWMKCHRRYIADVLKRRKYKVIHIYDEKKSERHLITKRRKIKCDKVNRTKNPD